MPKKHIKLSPTAGPSADEVWSAAVPVQFDGHPTAHLSSDGKLTFVLPGKTQTLALRTTAEGDLLLEFDA